MLDLADAFSDEGEVRSAMSAADQTGKAAGAGGTSVAPQRHERAQARPQLPLTLPRAKAEAVAG